MNIGKAIKVSRTRAGLTQQELADAAGYSQNFVHRIEIGDRNPSKRTLKSFAEAMNTTTDNIIREAEELS